MPTFRPKRPKVTFYAIPLGNGEEWRLLVHYPEEPIKYTSGFRSKAEAEAWASGPEGQAWLRAVFPFEQPATP